MRTHKIVKDSQGNKITICGSNRWQEIHYSCDTDDENDCSQFINHYGRKYRLDEFMSVQRSFSSHPDWLKGYDGYMNDSFFSGVLIKLSDCGDAAKIFTFIS